MFFYWEELRSMCGLSAVFYRFNFCVGDAIFALQRQSRDCFDDQSYSADGDTLRDLCRSQRAYRCNLQLPAPQRHCQRLVSISAMLSETGIVGEAVAAARSEHGIVGPDPKRGRRWHQIATASARSTLDTCALWPDDALAEPGAQLE